MNSPAAGVQILDCTLRDGGYQNNWCFGQTALHGLLHHLCAAGIDLIECGFLAREKSRPGRTVFGHALDMAPYLPKHSAARFVAMAIHGQYDPATLPEAPAPGLFGVRLSFNRHEADDALAGAQRLAQKGYAVFMQPVRLTTHYTPDEVARLVEKVNALGPHAFYLVDTYGALDSRQLLALYRLVRAGLDDAVAVGYHGHNNRQLAFACAKALIEAAPRRQPLLLDASLLGLGKAAGNLCTTLLVHAMAADYGATRYDFTAVLRAVDALATSGSLATSGGPVASESLPALESPPALDGLATSGSLASRNALPATEVLPIQNSALPPWAGPWGHTLPYFLATAAGCNPRYADYLLAHGVRSAAALYTALQQLPTAHRQLYAKDAAQAMYQHAAQV